MSVIPSKSQVRKSGDLLRRQLRSGRSMKDVQSDQKNTRAWEIVDAFRQRHVDPTIKVFLEWAYIVEEHAISTPVPRIKRETRIIEKIARDSTGLERLEDIGGVRLVVPSLSTQMHISMLFQEKFELVRVRDYVSTEGESPFDSNSSSGPKGSGYRAIHLVHKVDDVFIETQVRTQRQHYWAMAAEKAEQSTGFALKFGDAPPELLDYFRVAAEIEALKDMEKIVDSSLIEQLDELRKQILRYYRITGEAQ